MSETQKSSASDVKNPQIRHNLVDTAVNFLMNPTVKDKLDEHKSAFLRKKGLTESEIALAFDKANRQPNYNQIRENSKISNSAPALPHRVPVHPPVPSFWLHLSRFSSSLIVLGVAIFGAHYVYKKYIEPFIFGEDNRKKSLEKQLFDMAQSLSQLESHVASLEDSVSDQKAQLDKFIQTEVNEYYPTPLALRELKTEISSVKSLLLSRNQFPALPKVVPTIPQWQMPTEEKQEDPSKENVVSDKQDISHLDQFPALPKLVPTIPHWQMSTEENQEDPSKVENKQDISHKEEDSSSDLHGDSDLSNADMSTMDDILTDRAIVKELVPEEQSLHVS